VEKIKVYQLSDTTMEITCYYIHDDTFLKAFVFIQENDMIYVEVAHLKHKNYKLTKIITILV